MPQGVFIWKSYKNGNSYGMQVRECPDPEAVRQMLERDVVQGPVEWREQS